MLLCGNVIMAGDVVIIGRPVGVAADRDKVLEPKRAMVSAANDLDYRYESEIDMDELRRREEACWGACDEA